VQDIEWLNQSREETDEPKARWRALVHEEAETKK
jgi:hypothetical protein